MLTLQQIIQATPAAKLRAAQYVPALNAAMVKYEINTPLEQAAFLAQIFHETGNLATVEEGLNYSAPLEEPTPNRFSSAAVPRKPEA
jgi:putative chitinase